MWRIGSAVVVVAWWCAAVLAAPSEPSLRPVDSALTAALARYRTIAARGGWPTVPGDELLRPGGEDAAVPVLRRRLAATGELAPSAEPVAAPLVYDPALVEAVQAFQRRHGLHDDGVIGPHTRRALNVSVERRIAQIESNIARPTAEPMAHAGRWVDVDIASFRLALLENGERVLEMPVVVGRSDRPTPEFESAITFLILNPSWTVPTTLAYKDLLPKMRRDPTHFRRIGIHVFEGWYRGAPEIDPDWIDWTLIGKNIRRLKLRQAPGPANPLGRIKFHMVNAFDVYLHDTPSRELLREDRRTFSSGCVRVGDARALALALLEDDAEWTPERFDDVLESTETTVVSLRTPMPIRLAYRTAWVAPNDVVQFREDVYAQEPLWTAGPAAADDLAALERLGSAGPPGVSEGTP